MIELDELRSMLKVYNLAKIARGSGIHYNTIYGIYKGTTCPRYETILKLIKYLKNENLMM